ncbi:MAG: hypothetical protein ORN24_04395 [Burkholderiales bacterium]|nr:hypothetical protein [Burkholderiales bacterium]
MNPIQLAIIAFVVVVILITIGYYKYDELRFKKRVENNFNQATDDALITKNKAAVLDSIDANLPQQQTKLMQRDINSKADDSFDPLLDGGVKDSSNKEEASLNSKHISNLLETVTSDEQNFNNQIIPEDSVEAFFAKVYKITFPFANEINAKYDLVIDLVFEDELKIKLLPEISQYSNHSYQIYVLDKNDIWQVYQKSKKYIIKACKVVMLLVDQNGIMNQAQIENVYTEFYNFVLSNNGHIRSSNYIEDLVNIQHEMQALNNIALEIDLFINLEKPQSGSTLAQFLKNYGFAEEDGKFSLLNPQDKTTFFSVIADNGQAIAAKEMYDMLMIKAKYHLQSKPLDVFNQIFDFEEQFRRQFSSVILTAKKNIIKQQEYDQLEKYIKNYTDNAMKKNIQLGGVLIKRLFE